MEGWKIGEVDHHRDLVHWIAPPLGRGALWAVAARHISSRLTGRILGGIMRSSVYSNASGESITLREILSDIYALEEEMTDFECKYGLRSEIFYAAYIRGEEPEDDSWVLVFGEWASVYRPWLTRQAEYRNEVQRLQGSEPSLKGLIQVAA